MMLSRSLLLLFCILILKGEVWSQEIEDYSLSNLFNLRVMIATKTEVGQQQAPSIITVITSEEIFNMGARDITDILRTVPGFDVVQNPTNGNQQTIGVRGLFNHETNNGKIKFMLNGKNLCDDSCSMSYYFDSIAINNIRRIEIIQGPGSALYGSGSFLGVINIITRDGKVAGEGETTGRISISRGSFRKTSSHAEIAYQDGKLASYFFADYHSTQGHTEKIDSDSALGEFQGLAAAMNYTLPVSQAPGPSHNESDHYNLYTKIDFKNFMFHGLYSETDFMPYIGQTRNLVDNGNACELKVGFAEIQYKHAFNAQGGLTTKAFYNFSRYFVNVKLFADESTRFLNQIDLLAFNYELNHPAGTPIQGGFGSCDQQAGGETTLDYRLRPWLETVTGLYYEYMEKYNNKTYGNTHVFSPIGGDAILINNQTYQPYQYIDGYRDLSDAYPMLGEVDRNIFALYEQVVIDLKDLFAMEENVKNLTLTSGIRYDHYSDFGESINPRTGLVYAPHERLYFKILYGTAFRAASFDELTTQNNPYAFGNKDLKPEKIVTTEVLAGFRLADNINMTFTGFYNKAKNLIQLNTIGSIAEYQNIGKQESMGISSEIKFIFDLNKYLYCHATYQDVNNTTHATITSPAGLSYTQKDYRPEGIPDVIVNFGVNYDFWDFINANLHLNYIDARKRSGEKIFENEILVKADQRDPLKASFMLNTTFMFKMDYPSYHFEHLDFLDGLFLQLSCYNLLDEDRRDPDFSTEVAKDYPQAGRNFLVRISYQF